MTEQEAVMAESDPASAVVLYTVTRDEAGTVYVLDDRDQVVGTVRARAARRPELLADGIARAVREHLAGDELPTF